MFGSLVRIAAMTLITITPAMGEVLNARYIRDHAETRGFTLGRPAAPQPTPDGKSILFLRSQARSSRLHLFECDVATKQTRELLSPEQVLKGAEEELSAEEKARRERMRVSAGGFTSFQLSRNGELILLPLSGKLYLYHRAQEKITEVSIAAGAIDAKFSPDSSKIAYARDYNLFVYDLKSRKERALTKDGTALKSYGMAEFIAQEEMGRYSGFWWSPDSERLAYQMADSTGVEVWHVADPANPGQAPHSFGYPRPGKANVQVRLGVISARGGKTRWLDWNRERHPYLATVVWAADAPEAPLTLCVQTRDQRELVIYAANPKNGKLTELHVERDEAWINLDQQMPRWLPDASGFLWTTERDEGPALELRTRTGGFVRTIVPPSLGYQSFVHLDAVRQEIVFRAHPDPTEVHLYRGSLDGGEAHRLTHDRGAHNAIVGNGGELVIVSSSTPNAMPRTIVRDRSGTEIAVLPEIAEEPPFEQRAEIMNVGPSPGFFAEVIRPSNFDSSRKYPVIVEVYGGPTATVVSSARTGSQLLRHWMADQGFIVVAVDNRGTPGRGRAWERAMLNSFATITIEDQVAGVRALGEKIPQMDMDRVGMRGWSFGGYMSALAVLKRPDVFKAAVAGAPVAAFEDYDTHYTERYLGMPQTNADVYKETSLLTYANKLERPLLLVHGTADDNVFFLHSLKLADALFRNQQHFELLPLSGLTHMVPQPAAMENLWTRTIQFFKTHLGEPKNR